MIIIIKVKRKYVRRRIIAKSREYDLRRWYMFTRLVLIDFNDAHSYDNIQNMEAKYNMEDMVTDNITADI